MFITKTINESADIELEQFDLVDSICESYEDLLNFNEALAHFDIKEQELIHTESTDLDAFREEAMEKAKQFLSNLVAKITDLNKRIATFSSKYTGQQVTPFASAIGKIPEYNGKPVEINQFIKVLFNEILPKELDVITDIAFNKTSEDRKKYDCSERYESIYKVKRHYGPKGHISMFDVIENFIIKIDMKNTMSNIKNTIHKGNGYIDDAMKKLDNFKAETKEIASAANWVMVQSRKNYLFAVVQVQRYFYSIVNAIHNIALSIEAY